MSIRESGCVVAGVMIGCGISYMILKRLSDRHITRQHDIEKDGDSGQQKHLKDNALCGQHDLEEDGLNDTGWTDTKLQQTEKDKMEANDLKTFLLNHTKIPNLKVALPEDLFQPKKLLLLELSTILDTCRLVFIYPFINTESDGVAAYGKHINLLQSLKYPEKKNRIIPLQLGDAHISADLTVFNPLKYSKDINGTDFHEKLKDFVTGWRKKLP